MCLGDHGENITNRVNSRGGSSPEDEVAFATQKKLVSIYI